MEPKDIVLVVVLSIVAILVLLIAVIVIRALLFKDKTVYVRETDFTYQVDLGVKR